MTKKLLKLTIILWFLISTNTFASPPKEFIEGKIIYPESYHKIKVIAYKALREEEKEILSLRITLDELYNARHSLKYISGASDWAQLKCDYISSDSFFCQNTENLFRTLNKPNVLKLNADYTPDRNSTKSHLYAYIDKTIQHIEIKILQYAYHLDQFNQGDFYPLTPQQIYNIHKKSYFWLHEKEDYYNNKLSDSDEKDFYNAQEQGFIYPEYRLSDGDWYGDW